MRALVIQGRFGPTGPKLLEPAPVNCRILQRQTGFTGSHRVSAAFRFSSSAGAPLAPEVRAPMEDFFQADFSNVRIHTGPEAAAIGALAFTSGHDIYFAPGQFNPHVAHGRALIGHELTHVIQQRAGRVRNPFGSGVAIINDHHLETEADRLGLMAARHAVTQRLSGGSSPTAGTVQAKPGATLVPGHSVIWPGTVPGMTPSAIQMMKRKLPKPPPDEEKIERVTKNRKKEKNKAEVITVNEESDNPEKKTKRKPPGNQPWVYKKNKYGVSTRLTFSEAVGVTGGAETTVLDARLNGVDLGKFDNRKLMMGGATREDLLSHNYPAVSCSLPDQTIPHAEDHLLTALETERLARSWTRFASKKGKSGDVLSIRISRAPCIRCAKNLVNYCRQHKLHLRVKAGQYHADTDEDNLTGIGYLDSQGVPVRHWSGERMFSKTNHKGIALYSSWKPAPTVSTYKKTTRTELETQHHEKFKIDRTKYNIPLTSGWGEFSADVRRDNLSNLGETIQQKRPAIYWRRTPF